MKTWIALLSALLLTLSCAAAESPDAGETALLSLDANPSTGYCWTGSVLGDDAVQLDSPEGTYIPDEQAGTMIGSGGQTQYAVTAVKPGRSILVFEYRRSWESTALEQRAYLAVVDQNLNLSMTDVTETGVFRGAVLSLNEEERTALIEHDALGEILAQFSPEMSLPALGEQIVIYTDGTMALSLPARMHVLAWRCISPAEAGNAEDAMQPLSLAETTD